jgi:hypothetical protein
MRAGPLVGTWARANPGHAMTTTIDHGDACTVVESFFKAVIAVPLRYPRFAGATSFEIELLPIDIKRDAEEALEPIQKLVLEFDAAALIGAVIEEAEELTEEPSKQTKG